MGQEVEMDGKREASLCRKPLEDPPQGLRESHSKKLGMYTRTIPRVHARADVPSKVIIHDRSEREEGGGFSDYML